MDGGGKDWDELLPYIAMGYRISKQKAVGYSPYFLMFGRGPILQSRTQHLEDTLLDADINEEQLRVFLNERVQTSYASSHEERSDGTTTRYGAIQAS